MYGLTYDELHRFVYVPSPESGRPKFEQQGLREYLLCAECEARFNRHETYSARTVFGEHALAASAAGEFVVIHNVDYASLKLFQLSLLWRAGESTLPTFRSVVLGPHAETIRRMLLEGDPGEPGCFPCLMMCSRAVPGVVARAIFPPDRIRHEGYKCYRFIIGGVLYFFVASPSTGRLTLPQTYLSRAGDLLIDLDRGGSAGRLFEAKRRSLVALKRAHSERRDGAANRSFQRTRCARR